MPVTRPPEPTDVQPEPIDGQAVFEKARSLFVPQPIRKQQMYEAYTASQTAQAEPASEDEEPADEASWIEATATKLAASSDQHIERLEQAIETAKEKKWAAEIDAYETEEPADDEEAY
jgi:hypothetical protein